MQGQAWNKEKVIELLEPKLKLGYSIRKACESIGIPQPTVGTWVMNDKELQLKLKGWQDEVNDKAIANIKARIVEGDDPELSKWWLERRLREDFGNKLYTENRNVNTETEALDKDRTDDLIKSLSILSGEEVVESETDKEDSEDITFLN